MKQPLDQFYKENSKLIHFASLKAVKRFTAAGIGDRIEYEEVHGQMSEIFVKSYQQFDPERSKFSTYFVTACHNFVTDRMEKIFRLEVKTDSVNAYANSAEEDNRDNWEEILGTEESLEGQVALDSEIDYMRSGLSPFAKVLFDYSMCPPQFILDEFHAQRAQCALATSLGFKTSHSTEINLQFVANCLKGTSNNPETIKHIKKAVDEVKSAVMRAVRV